MNKILSLKDVQVANQRVLVRVDFNVPIKDGKITDDTRIRETLATLQQLLANNAKVLVLSHLGRPIIGEDNTKFSLLPVANRLRELLPYPVHFANNGLTNITLNSGELVVGENVRFLPGETTNDLTLAKALAALCDIFVMDAFACAHRAHASTEGIARFAPIAVAGPLLLKEITALNQVLQGKKPTIAIVGGSKISTKLPILQQLITKVDVLIIGGGIANTFLLAKGYNIGASLVERDLVSTAKTLLAQQQCQILLPEDVVVATEITNNAKTITKELSNLNNNEKILDIGPKTLNFYLSKLQQAQTILWNGPVGVFEYPQFANGTKQLAQAITNSNAFSVAGGGDTIAAIKQFNIHGISYISTGGGAFLEYLEGLSLPGIKILRH